MSNGQVLFINLINIHKKKKTVIAAIKLTIIRFANFKLNPKSYEMYNSNLSFPVKFSSRQGFLYLVFVNLGKKGPLVRVCGSLRRLGVLGTSNFDWQH